MSDFQPHDVRLKIYDYFGRPAREPQSFDLSAGATLWENTFKVGGDRGDVRYYSMNNLVGDREDDAQLSGKVDAIGPGWRLDAVDNTVADWERFPLPGEQQRITTTINAYQSELDTLLAVPTLTDDQKARVGELDTLIDDLSTNGYLEEMPGEPMGLAPTAIYRRLGAANIPFKYRSRFLIEQARPITLWIQRWKPEKKQVNHYLRVDISRKLRIEFRESDQMTVFRKNDRQDPVQWAANDARRDELLAKKYLTAVDTDDIAHEREQIAAIRKHAKDANRKLNAEEKAAIKTIQDGIKAIQKGHTLTGAEVAELRQLEAYLFHQTEKLNLAQSSDSLVGKVFALTMFDTGMGIVQFMLDSSESVVVFEDRYTTARKQQVWLWGTPTAVTDPNYSTEEKLTISGSGGAIAWRFGYVKVNATDKILTAPVFIHPTVTVNDVTVAGSWTDNIPDDPALALEFLFVAAPGLPPGWFQIGIYFATAEKYVPMVFRATLQVQAQPRPANVLVWDSADHPQAIISASPRLDEKRGRTYKVTIGRMRGTEDLALPERLYERVVTLLIDGNPAMTEGIIASEVSGPMTTVATDARPWVDVGATTNATTDPLPWAEWELDVVDKLRAARQARFLEDVVFDGMDLGDAVKLAYRNRGYRTDELTGIGTTGIMLPVPAPGEKAKIRPAHQCNAQAYIENQLVGEFGLDLELWVGEDGVINLTTIDDRTLDINYTPDNANPRLRYYEDKSNALQRTRSTDKYFTQFRVEGATDPETKKPFVAQYTLNEAVDGVNFASDPRYIGHHKPMETVRNPGLNSQTWVDFVLATKIRRHAHPTESWEIKVPLSDAFLPGDIIKVNGIPWRVVRVPKADIEADDMTVVLETP